jgi:hypothetical protein
LALAGAAPGVLGAASLANVMQGLLYETTALNPASYVGAPAVVLVVATAAWIPAWRRRSLVR